MRIVPKPDKSTPLLETDGRTVNQAWDDYFAFLGARGLSFLPDIASAPTNGQVLIYNSTLGLWVPGAN